MVAHLGAPTDTAHLITGLSLLSPLFPMPSHHDRGSLTTFPRLGRGWGAGVPGWESTLRSGSWPRCTGQPQLARPCPVCIPGWWARSMAPLWVFYSQGPPTPVLRSSTALKDSFLSCLLQGMVNTLSGPVQGAFLLGIPVPSQQAWFGMRWGSAPRHLADQETGCTGPGLHGPSLEFGQEGNRGCDWAWTGDAQCSQASEQRHWCCPVPQDEQQRGPTGSPSVREGGGALKLRWT